MKVLLTGGAGFIGQHVLRDLLARGHEVRVLDSLRKDVHSNGQWTPPAGVEFHVADVRDAAAIDRALSGAGCGAAPCCKSGLGRGCRRPARLRVVERCGHCRTPGRNGSRRHRPVDACKLHGRLWRRHRPLPGSRSRCARSQDHIRARGGTIRIAVPGVWGASEPGAGRRKMRQSIRATHMPAAKSRRNSTPATGRELPAGRSPHCAITTFTDPACRAIRPTPASRPSSRRRCGADKLRRFSRTASSGGTLCTCGTSLVPRF